MISWLYRWALRGVYHEFDGDVRKLERLGYEVVRRDPLHVVAARHRREAWYLVIIWLCLLGIVGVILVRAAFL